MSLRKKIANSSAATWILCWIVANYLRLVYHTTRWEIVNKRIPDTFQAPNTPMIAAAWHGRIGMLVYCIDQQRYANVLISNHRDGEIIARTIGFFKYKTIRGSSTKNKTGKRGTEALRAMLRALRVGQHVLITPDGPRGPRMHLTDGIITLAKLSGVPIVPVTFATSKRRISKSWDRFVFPLPFGRGVFVWGEPVSVPRDADKDALENLRRQVEKKLIDLSDQADELVGQEKIEPAPLPDTANSA